MSVKLLTWLVFGVGAALLPLVLAAVVLFNHDLLKSPSATWERGELLLISMTLLIAALGELVVNETAFKRIKIVIIASSGFLLFVSAIWYMDVWGSIILGQEFKREFLKQWSPWFFVFSLINAACIMLPKRSGKER